MIQRIQDQPLAFWLAFFSVVGLGIALNLPSPFSGFDCVIDFDAYESRGWPFIWWEGGTIAHLNNYFPQAFLGDLIVICLAGVSVGQFVVSSLDWARNIRRVKTQSW